MANIALIRRSFRVDGGAEQSFINYLDAYLRAGHRVTVICEKWSGVLPLGVKIIRLRLLGGRLLKLWLFWFRVQFVIRNERFDWVQSHDWIEKTQVIRLGDGLHSWWLAKLLDERRGLARLLTTASLFHRSKCWMESRALDSDRLKTVIVNSQFIAAQVTDQYPGLKNRVVVHRNVVRFESAPRRIVTRQSRAGHLNLLFVGSGWARKGLLKAVNVVESLSRLRPCSLTVYGTDKQAGTYKQYVLSRGLSDVVHFAGVIPMDAGVYSQYHVLILPTAYDPFPNVIAEALSVGLAVLTTSNSGAVDFKEFSQVLIADNHDHAVSRLVSFVPQQIDADAVNHFRDIFSQSFFEAALIKDGLV